MEHCSNGILANLNESIVVIKTYSDMFKNHSMGIPTGRYSRRHWFIGLVGLGGGGYHVLKNIGNMPVLIPWL